MLRKERIQYHADAITDIESVLYKLREKRIDFAIKKLNTNPLFMIFTKDARGQRMADIFIEGLSGFFN